MTDDYKPMTVSGLTIPPEIVAQFWKVMSDHLPSRFELRNVVLCAIKGGVNYDAAERFADRNIQLMRKRKVIRLHRADGSGRGRWELLTRDIGAMSGLTT